MMIIDPYKFDAGGMTVSVTGAGTNLTFSASPKTFSGVAIGTESSDRHVLVAVMINGIDSQAVSSATVTVAGISATPLVSQTGSSPVNAVAALYLAAVPTGETADVVVAHNGNNTSSVHVQTYALRGLQSTTPVDTATASHASTGASLSADIDCSAGGVVFAAYSAHDTASTVGAMTWTLSSADYDYDDGGGSSDSVAGAAHEQFAVAQIGLTVTATPNDAPNSGSAMVVASLR